MTAAVEVKHFRLYSSDPVDAVHSAVRLRFALPLGSGAVPTVKTGAAMLPSHYDRLCTYDSGDLPVARRSPIHHPGLCA